jgi:hypothetical protein
VTCSDAGSSVRDVPSTKPGEKGSGSRVDLVWAGAGTSLGFALSLVAAQAALASILGATLFLVSLRSSLAGLSAILCAIVFAGRVDFFGHWIYSLHLVLAVVFAALLLQVARRSNRSREMLGMTGVLGVLALLARFAETERSSVAGFDVAFGMQLCFLALLPRLFHTLWRESSPALAWCSSAFFLLLAVASVITGPVPYSWSFLRYVQLWGMAALAAACLRAEQTRLLLWLLGLLATVVATLGVAEHFGLVPADPFPVGAYTRASATFGQPNPFGGFLAMAVAATFGLWLRARGWRTKVACGMLLVLSTGLFATSSRGAIAACVAALLFVSMFALRGSGIKRGGIGLALVVVGSIPFWLNGTLMARWGVSAPTFFGNDEKQVSSESSGEAGQPRTPPPAPVVPPEAGGIAQRAAGLRTAAKIIEEHPWFGVGSGRYSDAVAGHAPTHLDKTYYDNHIHNLYLQIWIESGVFVLAAFLAGLCVFFVQSSRRLAAAPTLILPAVGIVVAACTHNLFDVVFVHGMQLLFGFALAVPVIAHQERSGI